MVNSLPKKTELPVVHLRSVVCSFHPPWPTLFPMGCRRFLGYTDCRPRHSWYTPPMLSALFFFFSTLLTRGESSTKLGLCSMDRWWFQEAAKESGTNLKPDIFIFSADCFSNYSRSKHFPPGTFPPNSHWDIELLILMAPCTNSTYSLILEMEKKIITYPT